MSIALTKLLSRDRPDPVPADQVLILTNYGIEHEKAKNTISWFQTLPFTNKLIILPFEVKQYGTGDAYNHYTEGYGDWEELEQFGDPSKLYFPRREPGVSDKSDYELNLHKLAQRSNLVAIPVFNKGNVRKGTTEYLLEVIQPEEIIYAAGYRSREIIRKIIPGQNPLQENIKWIESA